MTASSTDLYSLHPEMISRMNILCSGSMFWKKKNHSSSTNNILITFRTCFDLRRIFLPMAHHQKKKHVMEYNNLLVQIYTQFTKISRLFSWRRSWYTCRNWRKDLQQLWFDFLVFLAICYHLVGIDGQKQIFAINK